MSTRMRHLVSASASLLVCAGIASAQGSLWVVDDQAGPGVDFTAIQAGVDAAADGDALLVKTGLYEPFSIVAKSLAVVAEEGATVEVRKESNDFTPGVSVTGLGPQQVVLLQGLDLTRETEFVSQTEAAHGFSVTGCEGLVWIEDCDAIAAGLFAALNAVNADAVIVSHSTLRGFPAFDTFATGVARGVYAEDAEVRLYETTVEGGDGFASSSDFLLCQAGFNGAEAVLAQSGFVFAAGCTLAGGEGADGAPFAGALLPSNGTNGGNGIRLLSAGATVELIDTVTTAGTGGVATHFACGDGNDGTPLVPGDGAIDFRPGVAPSLRVDSPVRTGVTFEQVLTAPPQHFVAGAYSVVPTVLPVPGFIGALLTGAPLQVLPLGVLPGAGELVLPGQFGSLGGLDFVAVYAQPGSFDLDGDLHLGAPSAVLVIDGSF